MEYSLGSCPDWLLPWVVYLTLKLVIFLFFKFMPQSYSHSLIIFLLNKGEERNAKVHRLFCMMLSVLSFLGSHPVRKYQYSGGGREREEEREYECEYVCVLGLWLCKQRQLIPHSQILTHSQYSSLEISIVSMLRKLLFWVKLT